jgi:hypothetical protein
MQQDVFLRSAGRRSIHAAAALCAFASLTACSAVPDGVRAEPGDVAGDVAPAKLGTAGLAVCTRETGAVAYQGGPVVSNVRVTVVYWTSAVSFQSTLPSFYASLTNSSYFDWLNEYQTCTQSIGRGSLVTAVVDAHPIPAGITVRDTDIAAELLRLVQNGTITAPTFDATGAPRDVYMVHFPTGYSVLHENNHACSGTGSNPGSPICGFHGSFQQTDGRFVPYGVVTGVETCGTLCGPGDGLGNTTSSASHELLEAVTDPLVNVFPSTMEGWNTRTSPSVGGEEIVDLCQGINGQVAGFTVQKAWSDLQGACVLNNPCLSCATGTSCFCGDSICRPRTARCP